MEFRQLVSKLSKLPKNKRFFDMDFEKLRMRLLKQYVPELPLPDDGDNSTYFIIKGLRNYLKLRGRLDQDIGYLTEYLVQKLMFSKNLLCIARMQGVHQMQLIDLLAHYTFLVVNAECLKKLYWSVYFEGKVFNDIQFKISQLQLKIELVDPQFRVTSIRVMKALLNASDALSRSPLIFAPEKNKCIVEEFVDSLLGALRKILECHATFTVPVQDHMLNLHEGVKSISILLCVKKENFYALPDNMKDRIGVLIIDLGIVICSLSVIDLKRGLVKGMDLAISRLVEEHQFVMQEVAKTHPPTSSSLSFPRTNELGSIDFFLQNLQELAISEAGSIAFPKDQILRVQEDLTVLRSFLRKIVKQRNQNVKLQALWDGAMEVAYKAELVVDSIVLGDRLECLDTVAGEIMHITTEAKISDSIRNDNEAQGATNNSIHMESQLGTPALNEVLVGLDKEVKKITDRLTKGSKQRDIVSIVGMAGLGKTTLANAVYYHCSIRDHFHVRAWCTVSQAYSKHNLLAQILSSIDGGSPDRYLKEGENDLALRLKRVLLRNIYLIVLDDVWDIDAWNLLKDSLPDNVNGSRILFTSRSKNLSLQFKPDSELYHLCHRSDKECLELLQRKIFGKVEDCPLALIKVLTQVANKCKGLPHTVVIFAGILSRIEPDCWQEFANRLSSNTSIKTRPLELSYIHLPEYLKPCLLYFSAFQEDQDIPVRKLSWLWISEGFVQTTEGKSLEDVAEDYLNDLIGRSLVMVTKHRTLAGAKTCQVHDLVHEFCVAKAKEEYFLQMLYGSNDLSTLAGPCPHRLVISLTKAEEFEKSRVLFPELRCLLFFCSDPRKYYIKPRDCSLWFPILKLLRVLDIGDLNFAGSFPMELLLLVHLRHLAIDVYMESIPSAIDNLSRLETLLVSGGLVNVALPNTIWNIKTLRHLQITGSRLYGFSLPIGSIEISPDLDDLDTFHLAIECSGESLQKILKKLPSIRRLKCVGGDYPRNPSGILKLNSLHRLESLKLHWFFGCNFEFPVNLKKLTLSYNGWPWSEISTIGKLPNLEVLKLDCRSFEGEKWEMQEGEFSNLRFLKLSNLGLCRWTAYNSDNFSRLEKLVLFQCGLLEEVPSCLGEGPSIEMIEVQSGRESLVSSVKQIQQDQMDAGNQVLKIVIRSRWMKS